MGNDLVDTAYGLQPLSRMVRLYRTLARQASNDFYRGAFRDAMRAMIARYRANGPISHDERIAA